MIRNLTTFVQNVETGSEMKFGSSTVMDFAICKFSEKSQKYYDFIRRMTLQESQRAERFLKSARYTYDASALEIKNGLLLTGPVLDGFLEMQGDEKIEYENKIKDEKKQLITPREALPEFDIEIHKNIRKNQDFEGIRVDGRAPQMIEGDRMACFIENGYLNRVTMEEIAPMRPLLQATDWNGKIQFTVGRKHLSQFYYSILPILKQHGRIREFDSEEIGNYLPPEVSFRFYLDADNKNIFCRPVAAYGQKTVSPLDVYRYDRLTGSFRDEQREEEIIYRLNQIFPARDLESDLYHCDQDEDAVLDFMDSKMDLLFELGEVHSTDRFRSLNVKRKPKVSVGVSVESDIMNLSILSEDISLEELLEALESYRLKKKYHRLKNGDFLNVQEESIAMLEQLMKSLHMKPGEFVKGKMQVPAYRALYLDKMLEQSQDVYARRDSHFKKLVKEFKTVTDSDYEVPESLASIMRGYQRTGYKWLRTLDATGFGGILADDMGLGKTLQVISVLKAAKEEGREGTSLVVCPASLVYNWKEEFRRFAPDLQVTAVAGNQKERKEQIAGYNSQDVLVTSYDLLKRDIAEYEGKTFNFQIIDEAQFIKNHSTAAAKAVKLIQSSTKYALTGTPIENRLSELWSIFDYLMPGFLYDYKTFREEMETPIVKSADEDAMERLKKMVSPFILRRLKQDVLKDLPAKLEEIRYAHFENEQKKVYDGQVLHMKEVLENESEESFNKSKLQVLAELTKIRQICCDPSLILENYKGESAKREACLALIESAIEGEHRVLLFSQFTSMLALLEKDLEEKGIAYYKITGETPKEKRLELVDDFNSGSTPVFLISLKAGGTGLNLTGADVVIHYDPWWNVAAQNQATDRAHRIGQTKVVSVYKLIAQDTIEDKIVMMQEKKKDLAEQVLSGEMGGLSALSREELLELISE